MRAMIACVALFAWLLTNTTASAKPQTKIKDPEKRRLTQFVQKGDLDQDPSQASAWASDGTFQIGAMPKQTGPEAIRRFLAGFFGAKLFVKLEHQMVEVIESKKRLVYKAVAVYTLKNGNKLNIPYVN